MIKPGNPQWLFMMEAEGNDDAVNTRQARINAVIKELKSYWTVDKWGFYACLRRHNLEDATDREIEKIWDAIR